MTQEAFRTPHNVESIKQNAFSIPHKVETWSISAFLLPHAIENNPTEYRFRLRHKVELSSSLGELETVIIRINKVP